MKKFWKICAVVFLVVCVGATGGILLLCKDIPDEYFTSDEILSNTLEVTLNAKMVDNGELTIQDVVKDFQVIDVRPLSQYDYVENASYKYDLTFDCSNKWYLLYLKAKLECVAGVQEVDFSYTLLYFKTPNDVKGCNSV